MSNKSKFKKTVNPAELIDYCISEDGLNDGSFQQVYEEILSLCYWIKGFQPNNILELGSRGASFWLLSQLSTGKKCSVDIDPTRGSFIRYYMYEEDWKFVCGNSQHQSTFDKVESFCSSYDFIFIDGDHSYKGVEKDFHMYKKLLSPRGFICFHDIDPNHVFKDNMGGQVYKFWQELEEGSKLSLICSKSSGKIHFIGARRSHPNITQGFGGIGLWQPIEKDI